VSNQLSLNNPNLCFENFLSKDGLSDLQKCTHLGIGAHSDDLEIMAAHGIQECFEASDKWFVGLTLTNGAGSPRPEDLKKLDEADYIKLRIKEQMEAAKRGRYSAQLMLQWTSSQLRSVDSKVIDEVLKIIEITKPEVIYTHSLFDTHATHAATAVAVIRAVEKLAVAQRPKSILGCEVWGGMEWVPKSYKVFLPTGRFEFLEKELISVFKSQIVDGKDYVGGALGRRKSNAVFQDSYQLDQHSGGIYALEMNHFLGKKLKTVVDEIHSEFKKDQESKLNQFY
jgi:LmbE family N-acetylglucosaminyl deacetylase